MLGIEREQTSTGPRKERLVGRVQVLRKRSGQREGKRACEAQQTSPQHAVHRQRHVAAFCKPTATSHRSPTR